MIITRTEDMIQFARDSNLGSTVQSKRGEINSVAAGISINLEFYEAQNQLYNADDFIDYLKNY